MGGNNAPFQFDFNNQNPYFDMSMSQGSGNSFDSSALLENPTGLGPTVQTLNMMNKGGGIFDSLRPSDYMAGANVAMDLGFGLENLKNSKKLLKMKEEQFSLFKEDRQANIKQKDRLRNLDFTSGYTR